MTQKQPQAGEWWTCKGTRVRIVGLHSGGDYVCELNDGSLSLLSIGEWWHYLPDCTGWDWQPEVYPQYWTTLYVASDVAYVVRENGGEFGGWYCVMETGKSLRKLMSCTWSSEGRTQITKEEAEALVKPQESPDDWVEITDPNHVRRACDFVAGKTGHPDQWFTCTATIGFSQAAWPESRIRCRRKDLPVVESPDDWVTQDRVPPRRGIDQVHWSNWESHKWIDAAYNWDEGEIHGYRDEDDDTVVSVRCRRKDLPVTTDDSLAELDTQDDGHLNSYGSWNE